MFVREYQLADCREVTRLFYDTVHNVNAKDYNISCWRRRAKTILWK